MRDTLQDRLKQLPPFLVFALSRTHTPPLTRDDLKSRFAWDKRKARQRKKWNGIKLPRKKPTRRMFRDEVAKASGLHPRKVGRICFELSWDGIYVGDMVKFLHGCGIDFFRLSRVRYYLKHGCSKSKPFAHLTVSQLQKLEWLCEKYVKANSAQV